MLTRKTTAVALVIATLSVGAWRWADAALTPHGPPQFGSISLAIPGLTPGDLCTDRMVGACGKFPVYEVELAVSNPSPDMLRANYTLQGKQSDIVEPGGGFTMPTVVRTDTGFAVGRILQRRTKPVTLTLTWQQGTRRGTVTYVIPATMTTGYISPS